MSHDHEHGHDHSHDHDGPEASPTHLEATDLSIPDADLSLKGLNRRNFLRGTGLLGAGAAAASVLASASPASAESIQTPGPYSRSREQQGGFVWLSGDHHIHTQYSPDAQYRVSDQVRHASEYGLDWMVITDHGSVAHAKFGVDKVNPDIKVARQNFKDTLVFQGFEWNIPSAEHGTVFVAPGPNEVAVLKQFENTYDGVVNNATADSPVNEALAISGLAYLTQAVRQRLVADALMLANHPARKGIDSPHEFRNWRDTAPGIAVGMEGARVTRPVAYRRPAPPAVAVSTTSRRARPRSPATRWRATAPGVASTSSPRPSAACGTACSPRASRGGSPPTQTRTRSTPTGPRTPSPTTPTLRGTLRATRSTPSAGTAIPSMRAASRPPTPTSGRGSSAVPMSARPASATTRSWRASGLVESGSVTVT